MGLLDALLGRRDANPVRMVGFTPDGGLVGGGVTATTSLGLSAVWRCVDILSNGVSQLEWRERRGTLDLPPSRLVNRPHSMWTRREWTSLAVSTLALYDVHYLLKVGGEDAEGVPLGLLPLDPRIVQPASVDLFGASLLPAQEYWVGTSRLSRDQLVILHRSPQPGISDELAGVLRMARVTFAAAIAAEGYASRYWQAGGSPTVVLETDAVLPAEGPTSPQAISEAWASRRQKGPDHAPVLSGGLKARDFGADPTTASAVEARRELVADIGRYFGIATSILNAPAGDSETYSSTEMQGLDLVKYTLKNYIGAIEDAITDQLPGGRYMTMDTAPLVRSTVLSTAQAFQLATGGKAWIDVDEAREAYGYGPAEDPDRLNPPEVAPATQPQMANTGGRSDGG